MTEKEAKRITRAIRDAVEAHDEAGPWQWYVDDMCIDCSAKEFWEVVEHALRAT